MSETLGSLPSIPPRWFVRLFWVAQRAVYSVTVAEERGARGRHHHEQVRGRRVDLDVRRVRPARVTWSHVRQLAASVVLQDAVSRAAPAGRQVAGALAQRLQRARRGFARSPDPAPFDGGAGHERLTPRSTVA
jgi:hypothetical protein